MSRHHRIRMSQWDSISLDRADELLTWQDGIASSWLLMGSEGPDEALLGVGRVQVLTWPARPLIDQQWLDDASSEGGRGSHQRNGYEIKEWLAMPGRRFASEAKNENIDMLLLWLIDLDDGQSCNFYFFLLWLLLRKGVAYWNFWWWWLNFWLIFYTD